MGEDEPGPGSWVFHSRFWVSDHVTGRSVSGLIPWPLGPRKEGQSEAEVYAARVITRRIVRVCAYLFILLSITFLLFSLFDDVECYPTLDQGFLQEIIVLCRT